MNTEMNRRSFLATSVSSAVAGAALNNPLIADERDSELRLSTFRFDVTPPKGHSLCGGWIKPVSGVDDPLEAIGYVLLGAGKPIVATASIG